MRFYRHLIMEEFTDGTETSRSAGIPHRKRPSYKRRGRPPVVSAAGAIGAGHCLIGGNDRHSRRSSGDCESESEEQQYRLHDDLPSCQQLLQSG